MTPAKRSGVTFDPQTGAGVNQPVDRFHNQEAHSPEALTQMLHDLEASHRALEARLGIVTAELADQMQGVEARSDLATRRLALEVVQMGGALAHRMRALQAPITPFTPAMPRPAPRPRRNGFAWSVALAVLLCLGVAAFLLIREQDSTPAATPVPITASEPAAALPAALPPPTLATAAPQTAGAPAAAPQSAQTQTVPPKAASVTASAPLHTVKPAPRPVTHHRPVVPPPIPPADPGQSGERLIP
jgi:hypothetical protein